MVKCGGMTYQLGATWVSICVCVSIGTADERSLKDQQTNQGRPPNIVFIFTDDHAYSSVGAFGNPVIETPNIDRIAAEGVNFKEGLTLCALARYHRLTKDPEVLRAITAGVDQMIRECWQEDVDTFSYSACSLTRRTNPDGLFMLAVEALAYEAELTGNEEHKRILREGFNAAIPKDADQLLGKGLAQLIHFSPRAMHMLENEQSESP